LINEIDAFQQPFSHVFDDYHAIKNPDIDNALNFLIDRHPDNMHLVINTRSDPVLHLSRMRARDQLLELRAADLRFTHDEASMFLNQVMGLDLKPADIVTLDARTEGWIAGLQLAALSLRDRTGRAKVIAAFAGSHRFVIDYLAEEVLNRQPETTHEFLLATSILERVCAPLGNALTGFDSGQATLEYLENNNLFLVPLDDERRWYRYHHLFAEVLQQRLRREQPGREVELHRLASAWLEHSGWMEEALLHAFSAADYSRAPRLVISMAPDYLQRGRVKTLLSWMDALPDELSSTNGELLTYKGLVMTIFGNFDQARACAEKARLNISSDSPPVARGRLATLFCQLAIGDENLPAAYKFALDALDLIGAEDLFFRSLTLSMLSGLQPLLGDPNGAIRSLQEAVLVGEQMGQSFASVIANVNLAKQLSLKGRLQEAYSTCQRVFQQYVDGYGQPLPFAAVGMAYLMAATIAYEQNDLDQLRQYLHIGMEMLERMGMTGQMLEIGHIQLLEQWAAGDTGAALATARKGQEIAQQTGLKGYVTLFAAIEADIHLKSGNLPTAEGWLETANLSVARVDDPLRIEENIVFARLLLAQNHWVNALEVLEGLERAAVRTDHMRSLMKIFILKALTYHRQGNSGQAFDCLERALTLAEPEGYVRIFVDEGEPMRRLLLEYQLIIKKKMGDQVDNDSLHLLTYTDKLLEGFSPIAPAKKAKTETLLEPLSERELEILRLLAVGHSNQEIAEILVIAVSTVKSHINHLYGKLGTHRRIQAIATARDLGLLSE
jgi:LuxR family maltose regulon positive regulatory protein